MSVQAGVSTSAPPPAGSRSSPPPPSAVLSLDADENPATTDPSGVPQLITLVSKEGRRLLVSRTALMASELCKTTLEGDRDANEIPLYHIEGAIVEKVIDYLTYHVKIPPRKIEKPLVSSNMKDLVDQWDVKFIENGETQIVGPTGVVAPPSEKAQEMLFKLLLAANYLNIKSLLQLTCAKVASLMKGKTPDQIRSIFNIRNDYTQAEEEEVRKEYRDLIG